MLDKYSYISRFIVLISIASNFASCKEASSSKEQKTEFTVTKAISIDTIVSKDYVAEIQAARNVEIRSRISGFLDKIHVDEGQFVQENQILFSLNDANLKEEVNRAEAQYRSSIADAKVIEVELIGSKRLLEKNIISQAEYDMAKARHEASIARIAESKSILSNAQLQLTYCVIRAPFSGQINRLPIKAGSLLDEGELLTSISDNKEIFAYFNLSEREYLNYKKGNVFNSEIEFVMANGLAFPVKGKLEPIESEIDNSTGNITFRARFSNTEGLLKHGASGKVVLNTNLKNVLIIPQKSTFEVQDRICIYVLDDKGIVHVKSVNIKFRLGDFYILESGVGLNENIIYEGIQMIKEGDKPSTKFVNLLTIINP